MILYRTDMHLVLSDTANLQEGKGSQDSAIISSELYLQHTYRFLCCLGQHLLSEGRYLTCQVGELVKSITQPGRHAS